MKSKLNFITLFFIAVFSFACKPEKVDSEFAKFEGEFKSDSSPVITFVFTEKDQGLFVTVDGQDYGRAAIFNNTFAAQKMPRITEEIVVIEAIEGRFTFKYQNLKKELLSGKLIRTK